MLEQDVSHQHVRKVLCAHFLVNSREPSGSTAHESRWSQDRKLECELERCCKENNNLRCQVRHSHTELDEMRCREYDDRHDRHECHDLYDHCKWHCTSTKMTPLFSGGYVWPQPETPQIVVSLPQSPTPPRNLTPLPQPAQHHQAMAPHHPNASGVG